MSHKRIYMYMVTSGHTVFSHLKAMITGWEQGESEAGAQNQVAMR